MMKTGHLIRTVAAVVLTFLSCSCDRNFFRDSSKGLMMVSFRVDGERYECREKDSFEESPMRIAFYDGKFLDFHVDGFSVRNQEKKACLTFTVSDTKDIVTGKRYNLRYYTGENTDRVAEPPVFFAEFNGYRSVDGWVKLRSIEKYEDVEGYVIICGNFEFTAKNAEGKTVEIRHGTFDGIY